MSTMQLTNEDVESFRTNGYLLPHRQLFSEEKLGELEHIFNEHLADKGDKLSDELDTPHYRDARLLDFLLSDEVLDTVEPLVGPNIALWSSHFISKDPFTGRETPWHETVPSGTAASARTTGSSPSGWPWRTPAPERTGACAWSPGPTCSSGPRSTSRPT